MIYMTTEEFLSTSNYCPQKSQFYFKDKILHKGPVFSKALREKAINLCQEYDRKKISCLLVENDWGLIVWIENRVIKRRSSKTRKINERNNKYSLKRARERPIIACIDDSKVVQIKVKGILEKVGYKILNIREPVLSLVALSEEKPAVILMDINMPEYNGYQLCKLIHRSRKLKDVPIVMLTARTGAVDKIRSKMVGAVSYLTKPFEAEELINLVTSLAPIIQKKFEGNIK